MSQFYGRRSKVIAGCMTLLLCALAAGCGGGDAGRDPILGTGGSALAPTVTAFTPDDDAINVSVSAPGIAVTFDQPMAAIAGAASFTVTCVAPCANPTGTVAFDSTNTIATFT